MSDSMNDEKRALVPRLRFPEFREAEEWEKKSLAQVSESIFDGTHQTPTYTEKGIPFFSVENIVSGKTNKFISKDDYEEATRTNKSEKDDILLTRIGKIGFSAIVDWDYEFSIYVTLAVIKKSIKFNSYYLHSYFQSERYQREIFSKSLLNAVPCKINMDELRKTEVLLPGLPEQQKIADCLSSLDALIAAQADKLDALKTHKKGLMQQLFPREGETIPRLRFPEFREAGEWVSEELSSCLEKVIDYRGKAPPKSETGVPLITARNVRFGWLDMSCDEYIEADEYEEWMSKGIPKAGDILFTTEAPLGNVAPFPSTGKFALGQRVITLRTKAKKCLSEFLFQSLLGPRMQNEIDFHSTGSTAKGIKSAVFVKLSFYYPEIAEQQKIADCLSSLDALIAAQTEKLDALKTTRLPTNPNLL
ncbi:MAG: restriction endonuclease subunit S [Candidatus Competibacter sp.]|nr:restriction endonuclease subunit S [Candidatus Competibacter sp.]MDG4583895.1 restriction endonuclease subunit S [Candidatus Competibacter sp.]